jgi:hypothetical protein
VKRLLLLVGLGALAASLSACDAAPPAATVNGVEISQATLNDDLTQLITNPYAQCATQIQQGQAITVAGVGTTSRGDPNAATTSAAGATLQALVLDELERQALDRHGTTVTTTDVDRAKQDYMEQLQSDAAQSSVQCSVPTSDLTTKLPHDFVERQAASLAQQEAIEETIGHVDVSEAALRRYYRAHLSSVNQVCLNLLFATSQAAGQQIHNAVAGGTSFAQASQHPGVSPSSPTDGQVGCVYPSQVVGQFGTAIAATIDNLPVGRLAAPIAWSDPQSGMTYWLVVQMRQRHLVPLSQLGTQIRQVLLAQGATSVTRALRHIADTGHVTVDPQYGSWHGLRGVVPPLAPPVRFVPNPAANTSTSPSGSGITVPSGVHPPTPSSGG